MTSLAPPMKPAAFAEHQIMTFILDGQWPPGYALPAERILAQSLGITRPPLREALQRLAREGWLTIAHGKPTRVNDYLSQGGLGVLSTLARHGGTLSTEMITSLLEARVILLPGIAEQAGRQNSDLLIQFLQTRPGAAPDAMAAYDWSLQQVMVKAAGNPILNLIFNDFTPMYQLWCVAYFKDSQARGRSRVYYADLAAALEGGRSLASLVREMMQEALDQWQKK